MNRGATVGSVEPVASTRPTHGSGPARKPGPTARARRAKTTAIAYLFLAPSGIPLIAFVVVPMFRAGWASLHTWNLISPMKWAGLRNYQ